MSIDEPNYVTVEHTLDPHKFCVVVMKWNSNQDAHVAEKCSNRLSRVAADALAKSWAAAMKLEVR